MGKDRTEKDQIKLIVSKRVLRPPTSEDQRPRFVPSLFIAFAVSSPNVLRDVERVFWFGLILNRPLPGRRRPPLAVEVL